MSYWLQMPANTLAMEFLAFCRPDEPFNVIEMLPSAAQKTADVCAGAPIKGRANIAHQIKEEVKRGGRRGLDEARGFTPWLARAIDHLGDDIGIPLELSGSEVAVGPYSADIEARSKIDGTVVLIENQAEPSDHGHLGQVMTYLAGLKAQVIVWVAPTFREQQLSAIRWLNEHTADGFSFFAVRLRACRSAAALSRRFSSSSRSGLSGTATGNGLGVKPYRYSNNYIIVGTAPRADISIHLARNESGIYVRAGRSEGPEEIANLLEPHRAALESSLGTPLGPSGDYFLLKTSPRGHEAKEAWDEIIDWMAGQVERYRATLGSLFQGPP